MDMSINQITSDTPIEIEQHFRVSAGPGAGKTYWLANHIKNVLHKSERLCATRKIACITYTNVAVETILKCLGASADRVEVSTIHSFLYKHIVKPYASFIAQEYGLNVQKIDGHDDIVLSNYSFLDAWKTRTGQQRIRENNKVIEAIKAAKWRFDDSGNLIVKPDYPHSANGYSIKTDSYLKYKKMAWEKGVIHHDDVLFLSYQLLLRFPFILQVLRAKFPYFFVDEFQDTNPIQTKILEQICQNETIVGIIGDQAQSIYGFQGAAPIQFSSFTLSNMIDYQMADNRRCTNQIIDILDTIRTDISQNKHRNEEGKKPTIILGSTSTSHRKAQEQCDEEEVYSLSRYNITSNAMKRDMDSNVPSEDLLQKLYETDSNRERKSLVIACIKATELASQKRFKDAIKELERIFKDKRDKSKGKKEALKHISLLLHKYNYFKDKSMSEFLAFVNGNIKSTSDLRSGAPKTFYENHTYQQLAVCVKIIEDASLHRTIHKAKGAEFDNVLLILKEERDLEFLLNPDLENEEHRINYVAVSRAKEQLFIAVPSITEANKTRLETLFNMMED
jgi:DNA helicase II / ATP-dependent DNA helicase PcrA